MFVLAGLLTLACCQSHELDKLSPKTCIDITGSQLDKAYGEFFWYGNRHTISNDGKVLFFTYPRLQRFSLPDGRSITNLKDYYPYVCVFTRPLRVVPLRWLGPPGNEITYKKGYIWTEALNRSYVSQTGPELAMFDLRQRKPTLGQMKDNAVPWPRRFLTLTSLDFDDGQQVGKAGWIRETREKWELQTVRIGPDGRYYLSLLTQERKPKDRKGNELFKSWRIAYYVMGPQSGFKPWRPRDWQTSSSPGLLNSDPLTGATFKTVWHADHLDAKSSFGNKFVSIPISPSWIVTWLGFSGSRLFVHCYLGPGNDVQLDRLHLFEVNLAKRTLDDLGPNLITAMSENGRFMVLKNKADNKLWFVDMGNK